MGGRMTLDGVKLGGDAFTNICPPLDPRAVRTGPGSGEF